MTGIFRWLWKKIGLYLFLVLAFIVITLIAPIVTESVNAGKRAMALQDANTAIIAQRTRLIHEFQLYAQTLTTAGEAELTVQHRQLSLQKETLTVSINNAKPAWLLAVSDPHRLLTIEQQKLQLALVNQQLSAIEAAQKLLAMEAADLNFDENLSQQTKLVALLEERCAEATRSLAQYEENWRWRLRRWLESPDHENLVKSRITHCNSYDVSVTRLQNMTMGQRQAQQIQANSRAAYARLLNDASILQHAGQELADDNRRAQIILSASLTKKIELWAESLGLKTILAQAAFILALIVLTPLFIRLLSFFILAPLAMRRGAIRINIPTVIAEPIEAGATSQISLAIILNEHQELLVRQSYLQSSSLNSQIATRWLLNNKRPFTSLAAGLSFLTQIRGRGEATTLSAVRDGFSEIRKLTLADGAACILQPRAIAATVQPIGQPVRITSHWRIFSLSAWLTLQLRYLVFHGPAELILKGGRGVRVESAQAGRVFGQDQLIGFSPDLTYSVTRTETFWPYFLGREPLLKDRVMVGEGVLILEEAPQSSRDGKTRGGLEAIADAVLKLFGL